MKSASFKRGLPTDRNYPWDEPTLSKHGLPTPGMFVDLDTSEVVHQGFDLIIRTVLATSLLMVGCDPALAESRTSLARHLRQELRALFLSSQWNRDLYSCTNENYCGGVHPEKPGGHGSTKRIDHMMVDGKGLSLLPTHADNLSRMEKLLPPVRTIDENGELIQGMTGGHRPLLWVVALDLNALARKKPVIRPTAWRGGISGTEPPWLVTRLGLTERAA